MRMKDFRLYLKENEDSISEVSYILPDDSETKSKGAKIPDMVENQPYFSASVLLNAGTDEEGESLILVQNPRAINTEAIDGSMSAPQKIKPIGESVEVAQSRAFYESMMQMNQMAYTQIFKANAEAQKYIMDAMRENEKVLDRRLKTFLRDSRSEIDEDTPENPSGGTPDNLKTISDAVVGVFKRMTEKETGAE